MSPHTGFPEISEIGDAYEIVPKPSNVKKQLQFIYIEKVVQHFQAPKQPTKAYEYYIKPKT